MSSIFLSAGYFGKKEPPAKMIMPFARKATAALAERKVKTESLASQPLWNFRTNQPSLLSGISHSFQMTFAKEG